MDVRDVRLGKAIAILVRVPETAGQPVSPLATCAVVDLRTRTRLCIKLQTRDLSRTYEAPSR